MRARTPLLLLAVSLASPLPAQNPAAPDPGPPRATVRAVTDTLHGLVVHDPYRYMEDGADSSARAWMRAQGDYARRVLDAIPERAQLLARVRQLDESEPAQVPFAVPASGRVFYTLRKPGEEQGKLYYRDGLDGRDVLLVDQDAMHHAPAGGHFSIDWYWPSWDGRRVAYGLSRGDGGMPTLFVIDVARRQLTDSISRVQFNWLQWSADGSGFYYDRARDLSAGAPPSSRFLGTRLFFHRVRTDPSSDQPLLGAGVDPAVALDSVAVAALLIRPESRHAAVFVLWGNRAEISIYSTALADLQRGKPRWTKIADTSDTVINLDMYRDDLYIVRRVADGRQTIVRTPLASPDLAHATTVISPSDVTIQNLLPASDAMYVQAQAGGIGRVLRVPYAAGTPVVTTVPLPFQGAVGLSTDQLRAGALIALTSWTKGQRYLAYDAATGRTTTTTIQPVGPNDDPPDAVSEEVRVAAPDGASIPLSISYLRTMKRDGSAPTLLDVFGAFGVPYLPSFTPRRIAWFERGGVLAVCHVRGGGEFGEPWHRAGQRETKQSSWTDYLACAQWLIEHGYTSPERLVARASFLGAIAAGRAITTRPELFRAAVLEMGTNDALRAELEPNGPANVAELGTRNDSAGARALYAMSTYHHVADGTAYPAVLLTTRIGDASVASWQSAKLAARMQAATTSGRPVLLRLVAPSGGLSTSSRSQELEATADLYAFALWQIRAPQRVSTLSPELPPCCQHHD